MERLVTFPVSVLIERRPAASRWQDWSWRPHAVIPPAGQAVRPRLLRNDVENAVFYAGPLSVELHAADAAAYKQNLSLDRPVVYVCTRPVEHAPAATADSASEDGMIAPYHVTVSPDEAQVCMEGDDAVHPVPMPEFIQAKAQAFVDHHYREESFERRKRKGGGAGAHGTAPLQQGPAVPRPGWKVPNAQD